MVPGALVPLHEGYTLACIGFPLVRVNYLITYRYSVLTLPTCGKSFTNDIVADMTVFQLSTENEG